ncbi:hypothetical protein L596_017234 [Steinernema carpocapsae]|uniref:Uncharacterized protein n=1 Tax=Steinernema carpocapsae TaxID=34508 RepID=A0A4U5N111_STECR|nr:hypothetical protein L596_017234 [Steinernema carpocapsae]
MWSHFKLTRRERPVGFVNKCRETDRSSVSRIPTIRLFYLVSGSVKLSVVELCVRTGAANDFSRPALQLSGLAPFLDHPVVKQLTLF